MMRFFLGFEYDYWFEVGRMGSIGDELGRNPNATVWNRGVVLRTEFNW
jgi:hypothetical protein